MARVPLLGWDTDRWASRVPFGIGQQRPNNYLEIVRALAENRGELGFAHRILTQGVCDGCALGTKGLSDWTLHGVHLCNIRLRLLRLNTMPALDEARLADAAALARLDGGQLRDLGRLAHPMIRRAGDAGFTRISWDDALDMTAARIVEAGPDRTAFYLTSRGITNEVYYVAQKAARVMGTNNVDNAARVCHAPSTAALKGMIGVAASTCSYSDWIGTDLLVFIGSNPANNQPVATKYMHEAKKAGTRIVTVNAFREPGMERYWIPSVPESALFGTKLADETFLVHIGGDVAFLNGVLKHMVAEGWVDEGFIQAHTEGFAELRRELAAQEWGALEAYSGVTRTEMRAFASQIASARTAVWVWSMGVTQHAHGEDNVRAIVNLALAGGFIGREHSGVVPIRGHSGVQGGAEMGAYATAFPGGLPVNATNARHMSDLWGFEVPAEPGLTSPRMIAAALDGGLDVLHAAGGNFMDVMPEPRLVREALGGLALRVHQDIVLTSQMLVPAQEAVILLPAATRYETPGGVTQTSTERRISFSPEIEGRRVGEARPEWSIYADLVSRVRPDRAAHLAFADTHAIREEIARVVPAYAGIETLRRAGDQVQSGGRLLCTDGLFPLPGGRARFLPVPLTSNDIGPGEFRLSTRRGKQFNSIVQERKDSLTGATRDAVLMSASDANLMGLADGDEVVLESTVGTMRARVCVAAIKPGNLEVHWPEGNVLIDHRGLSQEVDIPDYNATVTVRAAIEGAHAAAAETPAGVGS